MYRRHCALPEEVFTLQLPFALSRDWPLDVQDRQLCMFECMSGNCMKVGVCFSEIASTEHGYTYAHRVSYSILCWF